MKYKRRIKKVKLKRILTDAERGWIEGVIDGEGCIRLHKHIAKNNRFQWIISLVISNTNLNLCKRVNESIDGSIYTMPENREMNYKKNISFMQIVKVLNGYYHNLNLL